jgi:hypothetical protein
VAGRFSTAPSPTSVILLSLSSLLSFLVAYDATKTYEVPAFVFFAFLELYVFLRTPMRPWLTDGRVDTVRYLIPNPMAACLHACIDLLL